MRNVAGSARRCASLLAVLGAGLAFVPPAAARTEKVRWIDPNGLGAEAASIAGFRVYVGRQSGVYDLVIDVRMASRSSGLLPLYHGDLELDAYTPVYLAMTAYDDQGRESPLSNEQVRMPTDTDQDGIPDDGAPSHLPCSPGEAFGCDDNCPYAANPAQEDAGGIGEASADGIGDACQCGDVSGDGVVTIADASVILSAFLGPGVAGIPRPDLCDVGAGPGCGPVDAKFIQRALFAPGSGAIRQQCAPALPPVP
jgi:hypothetical protein